MEAAQLPVSGLSLMFMLGLRHGFDPDHVAMIDSMVYRALGKRSDSKMASWIGTMFSLGHGLTVTAIAVVLGTTTGSIAIPAPVRDALEWLPTILLILVGTLNSRDLLRREVYQPRGWKIHFIPAALRDSSHPLAVVVIGVLFALVFETTTQAVVWGYAATASSGSAMALLCGLFFTAGMVTTDTVDCRLMVRLLRRAAGRADVLLYRRRIGWIVVVLSYSMACYALAVKLLPDLELGDVTFTACGFGLFFGLLIAYVGLDRPRLNLAHSTTKE